MFPLPFKPYNDFLRCWSIARSRNSTGRIWTYPKQVHAIHQAQIDVFQLGYDSRALFNNSNTELIKFQAFPSPGEAIYMSKQFFLFSFLQYLNTTSTVKLKQNSKTKIALIKFNCQCICRHDHMGDKHQTF